MDVDSTNATTPAQGAAARRPIGEFLVERGLVTDEELQAALVDQRQSGKRLGEILVERGAITRMALASVLGEQWEEAGRHLRAVVPVRLAGGKEAESGLAGGEELTDSLASLQAAVARLEELSGGPRREQDAAAAGPAFAELELALAGLSRQVGELRGAIDAPVVVESDLGERFAELDAFLRARDDEGEADQRLAQAVEGLGTRVDAELGVVEARLEELAEAVTRPVEPDPGTAERLDRIDAWLRERDGAGEALGDSLRATLDELGERLEQVVAPAPVDDELRERLARIEAKVSDRPDVDAGELLAEVRAAVERPRAIEPELLERFARVEALAAERPAADTSGLVERLDALEAAVREAGPRDDALVERLDAVRATIEDLGRRPDDTGSEGAAELAARFGSLEQELAGIRASLDSPRDDGLAERLEALRAAVESRPDDALAERLDAFERVLAESGERLAGRDLAWEAAVERLGRVEDAVGDQLAGRLDSLRAAVDDLGSPAGSDSAAELLARFGSLEQTLASIRAAVDAPRDDRLGEELQTLRATVEELGRPTGPDQALAERFGSLEQALAAVRSAVESRPDGAVLERLESFERVLTENRERLAGRDLAWEAAVERLGRVEDAVAEALTRGRDEELTGALDGVRAAVEGLKAPGESPAAAELLERFGSLEEALGAIRAGVDAARDGAVGERLEAVERVLASNGEQLAGRDLAWEAAVERLGRLEDSLHAALARPDADPAIEELAHRLDALRAELAARPDGVAARLETIERLLAETAERQSGHDPAWEAAVERLGRLEESLQSVGAAPDDPRLDEALARLGELRAAVDAPRDHEVVDAVRSTLLEGAHGLHERLGALEDVVRDALAPREEPRLDEALARLAELHTAVSSTVEPLRDDVRDAVGRVEDRLAGRDLAWEATVERLGRLEDSVRDALTPREEPRLDEALARLDALRNAVEAPRDAELLARLEHGLHELAGRPRHDGLEGALREAVDAAAGGLGARLDELHAAVERPREDPALADRVASLQSSLDERLTSLVAELSARPERSGELVGLLRRLARDSAASHEALADTLQSGLAELREALESPRDGALHERLDRVDAALAAPDASLERLAALESRLDALAAELPSAHDVSLTPIREALDELRAVAAEPAGARFLERLVARSHNQIAARIGELEQAFHEPAPAADLTGLAERDARIAELTEQLRARPIAEPAADRPAPGEPTSFLALVPAADGYRLIALEGPLPAQGDGLEVPEDDRDLVVARLGRSPYPGDARPCAYLQAS